MQEYFSYCDLQALQTMLDEPASSTFPPLLSPCSNGNLDLLEPNMLQASFLFDLLVSETMDTSIQNIGDPEPLPLSSSDIGTTLPEQSAITATTTARNHKAGTDLNVFNHPTKCLNVEDDIEFALSLFHNFEPLPTPKSLKSFKITNSTLGATQSHPQPVPIACTASTATTTTTPATMNPPTKSSSNRRLCQAENCVKNVRSKGYCKAHGGGRHCRTLGCDKEAQNGHYCIGHGGGKCCQFEGCSNAAQSQGLCKAHGGGARCKHPNCEKSSQGGGFCRSHGGGKRCIEPGCMKGAQRGSKCAKHGGCRTCTIENCNRTDRGGGFCELHRKDKLCKIAGCKRLKKSIDMCTPHVREWRVQMAIVP